MNINKLKRGMVIKDFPTLCDLLEIKRVEGTNSKNAVLKELGRYFKIRKEGRNFIIEKKYTKIRDKQDGRKDNGGRNKKYLNILSDKEIKGEFDGYYVYIHKADNDIIYVGKGSRRRCIDMSCRPYKEEVTEIQLVKRFEKEIEALNYERCLINYYKKMGMCKYNGDKYVCGPINKETKKIFSKGKKRKANKTKKDRINKIKKEDTLKKLKEEKANLKKLKEEEKIMLKKFKEEEKAILKKLKEEEKIMLRKLKEEERFNLAVEKKRKKMFKYEI